MGWQMPNTCQYASEFQRVIKIGGVNVPHARLASKNNSTTTGFSLRNDELLANWTNYRGRDEAAISAIGDSRSIERIRLEFGPFESVWSLGRAKCRPSRRRRDAVYFRDGTSGRWTHLRISQEALMALYNQPDIRPDIFVNVALRRMEIRCHFGFSKLSTRATSCRDRWTMTKVALACRWC